MKKLTIAIGLLLISVNIKAQLTPTENYIQTKTYLDYNGTTPTKTSETVQYFDGLGRPKQVVGVKASPLGKDVVTHIEYDQFGRPTKDFLPIPQSGTQNGGIYTSPLGNASSVYGSEKIYSEKILENSPLDRIQQQIQVGNDWSGKPVKFEYDANIHEDYVRKYETTTTWVAERTQTSVQLLQYFLPAQLYKNTIIDEDGNKTIEFKNGKGQLILSRKVLSSTENADTYYVYNEYDQLAFVIPPMASAPTVVPDTVEKMYYQYRYDGRGRLVEKKLPGKGWEYMVYDKADRLIMSQDANLKAANQWLYTKYDRFGRIVYTGISNNEASRQAIQNNANANANLYETRSTTPGLTLNGMPVYYTKAATPTSIAQVLSVNYYDTYPAGTPGFTNVFSQPLLTDDPAQARTTKGLPTASYVKNIEDDGWTKNYTWYDTKGRVIGTRSINHLGGYTVHHHKLDFSGMILQTNTYHRRVMADTEKKIVEKFTYDAQNRLLTHTHQVDANPVEYLAQNKYNELSQLESKKVGGTAAASPLQIVDYKYNIRGWMTKINDPGNLNGKLFAYELKYQNPAYSSVSPGRYNGNIAEVDWVNGGNGKLRRYNYQYDGLNRLTNGIYSEPNTTVPQNNYYNETLSYDINGNILSLKRNWYVDNLGIQLIDNLNYTYAGNRLDKVDDSSGNYSGYPSTSGNLITYDSNGNMKDHIDKGMLQIGYNHLNLPNYIKFDKEYVSHDWENTYNVNTRYLYRADGTKLKKVYTYGSGRTNVETISTTDYMDGFQYANDILSFLPTSEGYYDYVKNKYAYNYVDHLGNIRVSYFNNGSGLQILDENSYYPFGLKHGTGGSANPDYHYEYNGKEHQVETDWYDYGARMYMADLGRWGVVDPLAEKGRRFSPYNYALDNPIMFVDPDGRWVRGAGFWNNLTKSDARIHAEQWADKLGSGNYNVAVNKGNNGTWNVTSHTLNLSIKDTFNSKGLVNTLYTGSAEGGGLGTAPSSVNPWGATISSIPESRGKTELQMQVSENPFVQTAAIGVLTGGIGNAISRALRSSSPLVITEESIMKAMENAPLSTQQAAVSLPKIKNYYTLLKQGSQPPAILVNEEGVIIEGNHRYISSRLYNNYPIKIQKTDIYYEDAITPWNQVYIDPKPW